MYPLSLTRRSSDLERRIDVEWARDDSIPSSYPVKLTVSCDDRFGMLKQITAVISDSKTNIRNVEARTRSEEHTSELQSPMYLVCRLLLEKKKKSCIDDRPINVHLTYPFLACARYLDYPSHSKSRD